MAPTKNKTSALLLVALVAVVSAALLSCDASDSNTGGARADGSWDKLCEAWDGCKDPVNGTIPSLCQIECRNKGYVLNKSGCKADGSQMMCCCFK